MLLRGRRQVQGVRVCVRLSVSLCVCVGVGLGVLVRMVFIQQACYYEVGDKFKVCVRVC